MKIRSHQDIYPIYYLDPPWDEDVRRECMAHLNENVQVPRDVYGWIKRKNCPYQREHYAGMMAQCLSEMQEEGMRMDYGMRLEVEARLHEIIRYAQTDQIAEEILAKERQQMAMEAKPIYAVNPTYYTSEERMQHLERQVDHLTQVVENLKNEQDTPVCSYIMPNEIRSKVEIDSDLRQACAQSGPALAKYLKKAQAMAYMDFRGDGLPMIYETLRRYYTIGCKYDAFYRACTNTDFFPITIKK